MIKPIMAALAANMDRVVTFTTVSAALSTVAIFIAYASWLVVSVTFLIVSKDAAFLTATATSAALAAKLATTATLQVISITLNTFIVVCFLFVDCY